MMDERNQYRRALERVRALRGFYVHLMVYVAVSLGLIAIDWLTAPPGLTWSYYPLVGWGVALAIHALVVFVAEGAFGHDWEERKVEELMRQEPSRLKRDGAHGPTVMSDELRDEVSGRSPVRLR
jgi:hypothetical protein